MTAIPDRAGRFARYLRLGLGLVWRAAPGLVSATIVLQVVLGLATIGAVVVGGRLAERLVRTPTDGAAGTTPLILLFLGVTLVALCASVVKSEYQRVLAELVERHATDVVVRAAADAELIDYERPEFHDLLVRAMQSAVTRPMRLVSALLGLVSSAVTVVGLGLTMLALAPQLLLVVLVGVIPLWWVTRLATSRTYTFQVAQTERDRKRDYFLNTLASRANAGEIRVFGIGHELRRRIATLHGERIDELGALVRYRAGLAVASAVISAAIGGVVLFALVELFESGSVDVERAAVVAAGFLVLSQRLLTLSSSAGSVFECALFLTDVDRMTSRPAAVDDGAPVEPIERLAVRGVSFRYPAGGHPVLHEVDLEFRRGQLVAIVGQNGSGKTTLARILALLHQPTDGAMMINGRSHDHARSVAVRRRVAMVHQEYLQLMMSAAENIALGALGAVDDRRRIVDAARIAAVDETIERLPEGYDTLLGTEFSGGHELSGGQWQRLSIARALFRDADVIILDEPASALDPEAEIELVDRLRVLAREKLVVLISHRFGTVSTADRIVVLDDGWVVEDGTHDELLADRGLYASMYTIQASTFR